MGYRHSQEQILAGVFATASEDGLSRLTFGRVARRLGVSDRVVVYYFPTTEALAGAVLEQVGAQLQSLLDSAFDGASESTPGNHLDLARAAWPALARPATDPLFRLYFEAIGLAVSGREPFRTLAADLTRGWTDWLAARLTGTAAERRAQAEATIALVDGLLLVRQLAGPRAAQRAAAALGLR